MKPTRRHVLQLVAAAGALPATSQLARTETYPSRPVTLVVPFPPGGPTDTLARIVADRMKTSLG
jgi:tripartite-type tricarboxylate transporter receptor subunit TctC